MTNTQYIKAPILKSFQSSYSGAHRGLADWYAPLRFELENTLKTEQPFDTGWYSSKHEIATARIFTPTETTLRVEVSVSDDLDTPGFGFAEQTLPASIHDVENMIYEAWEEAEADQNNNRDWTMFKITTTDDDGRLMWVDTYLRNDSPWGDEIDPPGDHYHQWGFQGEYDIPTETRRKLRHFAENLFSLGKTQLHHNGFTIEIVD